MESEGCGEKVRSDRRLFFAAATSAKISRPGLSRQILTRASISSARPRLKVDSSGRSSQCLLQSPVPFTPSRTGARHAPIPQPRDVRSRHRPSVELRLPNRNPNQRPRPRHPWPRLKSLQSRLDISTFPFKSRSRRQKPQSSRARCLFPATFSSPEARFQSIRKSLSHRPRENPLGSPSRPVNMSPKRNTRRNWQIFAEGVCGSVSRTCTGAKRGQTRSGLRVEPPGKKRSERF